MKRISNNHTNSHDENLLVVAAIEGYAHVHGISTIESFELLKRFNIINRIRANYSTLHMMPLDESVNFADDLVRKMSA
jgi:hypothetical protein